MSAVLTKSAVSTKDRPQSEVGNSDAYNRSQFRRAIVSRSDRMAEMPVVPRRELLRVLIVDDYRASADTMAMLVGVWGHDVRRAYDGATGLALAAAYQPDVLLLDIFMPGIRGLELASQVRRQARLNDCLLVAVTGRTDAGHRLQCEEAGLELFLIKPVNLSFLRTLLAAESEYRLQSQQDNLNVSHAVKNVAAAYRFEFT
jgi:CheY-like chemotaxis protein